LAPAAQAFPHVPQSVASLRVSAQWSDAPEPHEVRGASQVTLQRPARQNWPVAHRTPHPPQFEASVRVSVHTPPQSVVPPEQPHAPAVQS
jgi:hypothetical protein